MFLNSSVAPFGSEVAGGILAGSAAALSVLVWAAFRFLRAPAEKHLTGTLAISVAVVGLQAVNVPPMVLLLGGAAAGAALLKADDV